MDANLGCIGLYRSFFDCGADGVASSNSGCAAIFSPAPCCAGSGAGVPFLDLFACNPACARIRKLPLPRQVVVVKHTRYGLSLMARLRCASATRFCASATRRARSSADGSATVGPADTVALAAGRATGAAGVGEGAELAPGVPFFIAAIFAAISARFCAISAFASS